LPDTLPRFPLDHNFELLLPPKAAARVLSNVPQERYTSPESLTLVPAYRQTITIVHSPEVIFAQILIANPNKVVLKSRIDPAQLCSTGIDARA
jgi:hypothetical protein